ncbi:MAG: hypothetical protein M3Y31_09005 [Gemmatimonadota bacterium]|nr:hypothetical protein [Gemmatimonadota bacterium]
MRTFLTTLALAFTAGCSIAGHQRVEDSLLSARAGPDGRSLHVEVGTIAELRVDSAFRYAGGQRFLLNDAADAEQHFFVASGPDGSVEAVFWIQLERLLASAEGSYDYSDDPVRPVHDLPMHVQTRRYDSPPPPDGDRGRAYAFLRSRGYEIPEPAVRARLVHLPAPSKREELMIIYIEPFEGNGDLTPEAGDALVARAVGRIRPVRRISPRTAAGTPQP